jgi:cell division septation protein DedD
MRRILYPTTAALALLGLMFAFPLSARAAASMSVSAASSAKVGDNVTVTVNVNTGGESANAFEATFSYPDALFDGVRGTYSGGVCNIAISQPDPSGGHAQISCGATGGATGSVNVATFVLKAVASGSGSLALSGCSVLANDGKGTDITGGCGSRTITVNDVPVTTPPPTSEPTAEATPKVTPTPTPKPSTTPVPKSAEKPTEAPATAAPAPPRVQELPSSTPTAVPVAAASSTPGDGGGGDTPSQAEGKRSIGQAFTDLFTSLKGIGGLKNESTGVVALLLTLLPVLALIFAILFVIFRLAKQEKRRKRTLDRLFEMELSELAALEAKMDLLSEKGTKGRDEYREEFRMTKEKILRELKPDYAKPVDPPKESATPDAKPLSGS